MRLRLAGSSETMAQARVHLSAVCLIKLFLTITWTWDGP